MAARVLGIARLADEVDRLTAAPVTSQR